MAYLYTERAGARSDGERGSDSSGGINRTDHLRCVIAARYLLTPIIEDTSLLDAERREAMLANEVLGRLYILLRRKSSPTLAHRR